MKDKNWALKINTLEFYELISKSYDSLYKDEQVKKYMLVNKFILKRNKCLSLDCGCGTGIFIDLFHKKLNSIVGVDFSKNMLKEAKMKLKNKSSNVHFIRADVDFLPLKSRIFDKIFCFTLIQNVPNLSLTINELIRVSKKDCIFIISFLKNSISKKDFLSVLNSNGLKLIALYESEEVKDIIAVCKKE